MKKSFSFILALILAFTFVIPTLTFIPALAEGSGENTNSGTTPEKQATSATLTMVKGGANAIATMTFDDGHPRTAEKLNELLAKYNGKASLMIYPRKSFTSASTIQYWNQIASEGYLNIESHSYTHDYITNDHPENHYEEKYVYETEGAKDFIRESVPGQEVLSMTVPYASYIKDAYKHVISTYYSALANSCALVSYPGKMQSLDPTFANPATGDHPSGSWHDVYYVRLQPIYSETVYPQLTMENIIGYLDKCVAQNGWFITSCHGIYQGENQDLTEEQLVMLLEAMNAYQKENKLWVTSFSEATKYIRERQNSKVSAYTYGDGIYYVDLTMADTTADGLSLTETVTLGDGTVDKIFDMPLTVKVEVPNGWEEVSYTQAGGEKMFAETFTELGRTYAYVDLVPNGGTAAVALSSGESTGGDVLEKPVGSYTAPIGSYVPENPDVVFATFASENDFKGGKDPINEYTVASLTQEAVDEAAYIHLYKDITTSVKFKLSKTLVINLAGHSLTSPSGLAEVKTGGSLTVKNGFHNNKQQIHSRAGSTLIYDNVHLTNTYTTFGWGLGSDLIIFRDCKLDMNSTGFYFFMSGNDHKKTKSEMKFINTDLNVNAGVSSDYGLFRINESDYYTTKWTITFDKDSAITGSISNWATCIESTTIGPASGGEADKYQRFAYTQRIFFEDGVIFSEGAKPDFTYDYVKLSDDNASLTNLYDLSADDSILKMAVVYPGTEYKLIGEPEFVDEGGYYTITVPGGRIDAPAGTYIPREGVWTPDDSAITYALWATENAYLTGKSPYKTFTSTTLNYSDFAAGGYVHLYRDLSTSNEDISAKGTTSLTLDLAGHTLTIASTYTFCTTDTGVLNVKNGKVITSRQLSFRGDSKILFENIHYVNTNGAFGYGNAFSNWTIKDSLLEMNAASTYIFIGGNATINSTKTEMFFINTDLVVNGSANTTNGLFKINVTAKKFGPKIYFDKDSSVTGDVGLFATVTETAANAFSSPVEFYLEEGFTVSSSVSTSIFKYTGALREGTEGNYTVSAPLERDVNDGKLNVIVTLPGEITPTEYEYSFEKAGDLYVLDVNTPAIDPDPDPDPTPDPDGWQPSAGTTYAVWASKEDYLAGNSPIAEFQGALTVANLTAAGKTNYIRVYASAIETSDCIWPQNGETVHIDLGGNTLTNAYGCEIVGGATFILENGTYNHTNKQAYYKDACHATYRNLTVNMSTYANITYGGGFTELTYENCTVNLNGVNNYFRLSAIAGGTRYKLNIINTDFVVNVALAQPFFYFMESSYSADCNYEINIDKNSSITGNGSMPAFASLYENYLLLSGTHYHEKYVYTQNINIEEGFEISKNLLTGFGTYEFYELDLEASKTAGTAVYKAPVTLIANDERFSVTLGGVLANDGRLYLNPNANNTAYAPSYKMDKVNIGWYRFDSATGAWVGTPAVKTESGNALFTPADYKSFTKGETILFAQNIEVQSEIISSNVNNTDYVFDLAGNKLVLNNTFALSLYSGGAYQYTSITFKNGTVEGNVGQPFYGYGHKDGVFTFENITFNYAKGGTMASVYTGTFRFIDCVINAERGTAFAFQNADLYQAFEIEGTTINASTVVQYLGACTNLGGYNCYVKDSVINATSSIVDNKLSALTYRTLRISGSELNVLGIIRTPEAAGLTSVELSECKLTGAPKILVGDTPSENTDYAKVVLASTERIMAVSGLDGFSYVVGKSPLASGDLQANLTLYTDFQLNIFAKGDVVSSVLANGKALEYTVFEGKNKYVISDITPDTAAETLVLTVTATVDGVTYTFDIEYSVLAYAKAIIASETVSKEAKELISAAMAYVKAAYVYTGKTAPEFLGVDYEEFEAKGTEKNLPGAIKGAQLDLYSGFKLRFNITEGYTGKIVVNGVSYEVVEGSYNGITYIEVEMRAYALYDTAVTITADGVTGTYSLANYVAFANEKGGTLADLANALYTYSAYANSYKTLEQ